MTEQVVSYIDLPSEERKRRKEEQKNSHLSYTNRWLGVLPFAFRMMFRRTD
ncbi:YqzE family protein [Virgibacillus sp. YIM 98842]|uniref:YqzE family protein n=1 Tax=Virgibacillus sp. YIM 98842 TaxID=2663533 RepID=UPI001F0901BB|nr:YqzE family protein [Virgibacillus sp. YIM 98842]